MLPRHANGVREAKALARLGLVAAARAFVTASGVLRGREAPSRAFFASTAADEFAGAARAAVSLRRAAASFAMRAAGARNAAAADTLRLARGILERAMRAVRAAAHALARLEPPHAAREAHARAGAAATTARHSRRRAPPTLKAPSGARRDAVCPRYACFAVRRGARARQRGTRLAAPSRGACVAARLAAECLMLAQGAIVAAIHIRRGREHARRAICAVAIRRGAGRR